MSNASFSPYRWFTELSGQNQIAFVQRVRSQLAKADPDESACLGSWEDGKQIEYKTKLPLPGGKMTDLVPISFSVRGDVRLLWRAFKSRVNSSVLDFSAGMSRISGREEYVETRYASIGVGWLQVFEDGGALRFLVNDLQPIMIPPDALHKQSQMFADIKSPGWRIVPAFGQLNIVGAFSGMGPEIKKVVADAPLRLGILRVSAGITCIGLMMDGLVEDWTMMSFCLPILNSQQARLKPTSPGGPKSLLLAMVDIDSQNVAVYRNVTMPNAWGCILDDLIAEQEMLTGKYSSDQAVKELESMKKRWSSFKEMAGDFIAVGEDRSPTGIESPL